jgi:alkylation response protein AidB-like acyl-CoA dehydrogenase
MSTETVEEFRLRARTWLKENLQPATPQPPWIEDISAWHHTRELQKVLFDGGFAGICYPAEYGGLGLGAEYQRAFTAESRGYEMPVHLNVPTLTICLPTILDLGTEEQKQAHIPAVLRGEELLVQFLSEPRGGSDLAGLVTRAEQDSDGNWVLNGAKIWSSGAYAADFGLCLARTNWDVPKHQGLTMFIVPVRAPGVTVRQIKQVTGVTEFCEEFFDDVVLSPDTVIGEVDRGWEVAGRLLFHERSALGRGSKYASGYRAWIGRNPTELVEIARQTGQLDDVRVREDIGEARAMAIVQEHLIDRIAGAIAAEQLPPAASSIIRLSRAESEWLQTDLTVRIAGAAGATGGLLGTGDAELGLGRAGQDYLYRQAMSLAGGTTEIARNIISERVLGMPREAAADRDVPFKDVKRGR